MACYAAAIVALTARRSRVAPATLAVGTAAGIVLGVVMYAVAPLGLASHATSPWLSGAAIGSVVLVALIVLFGAPLVAGRVAAQCYRGSGSPGQLANARGWQGGAAGFLATGVGALFVTVLGTGTIALMPRASWLLRWLYPGQHVLAAVAYNRELMASANAAGYFLILLVFPVVGFVLGAVGLILGVCPAPPATPALRRAAAARRALSRRRIRPAAGKLACLPERGRHRTARRVMDALSRYDPTDRTGPDRAAGGIRSLLPPWIGALGSAERGSELIQSCIVASMVSRRAGRISPTWDPAL